MSLEHVTDHSDQALARLIHKFRKEKIQRLLEILCVPIQRLEDAFWQLYSERWLSSSEGAQLDLIGRIVGQRRAGEDDDIYRLKLGARIRANLSSGATDEVLAVFFALFGGDLDVESVNYDGDVAEFVIRVHDVLTSDEAAIALEFLRDSKADGVRAILEWQEQANADTFTFDGVNGQGFDEGAFADAVEA